MSYLCRTLNQFRRGTTTGNVNFLWPKNTKFGQISSNPLAVTNVVHYSKRDNSKDSNDPFKVVKSKVRINDFNCFEGGPNWELLSPRGNRFYFPNAIGPAWQGASTTIHTEVPLSALVNFEGKTNEKQKLQLKIEICPFLIKDSLHELFPVPEVVTTKKLTLLTLRFTGGCEAGAAKFVLAAREISERLRLKGYWADFMNPFSGKPFFSWANGKNLYKVDQRFRGLNMKLMSFNSCTVISSEEDDADRIFSGSIYTNGPSKYTELRSILDHQLFGFKNNEQ